MAQMRASGDTASLSFANMLFAGMLLSFLRLKFGTRKTSIRGHLDNFLARKSSPAQKGLRPQIQRMLCALGQAVAISQANALLVPRVDLLSVSVPTQRVGAKDSCSMGASCVETSVDFSASIR